MSPVPVSSNNQIIIKTLIEAPPRTDVPQKGLALGEILSAKVLQKLADNKYILSLKDLRLVATSEIPLKAGEILTAKINSLYPQIILNLINEENQAAQTRVNEKVGQWLANPESLLGVINKASEFTKLLQMVNLPPILSRNDIVKLVKLLDNIIFSSTNKNSKLFLKEFVSKTGLTLENTLKQLAEESLKGN